MKKLRIALFCIALLLLPAAWGYCLQADLRILYVNDFHGFAQPHKPPDGEELLGGAPYLAGAVARLSKARPTLLLAAGDMIHGDNWANLFQGKSVLDLMNAMAFDAMAVGNHEFDYGLKVLQKRISEARFPILGANVAGLPPLQPYTIKNLQGVKIAIIGVAPQETPTLTHPRNVAGLKFTAPEETLKKYLGELRGRADLVIVLSHIGYQEDRGLAEKVPGIDVIIGGHSHTRLLEPAKVGNTIIAQAWEHGKALGVLDLRVQDGKIHNFTGYLQEIKPEVGKEDPRVRALVAGYNRKADAILNRAVATTAVDLDGRHVKTAETNLGNLIADVMRQESGADAAIINGGGIRGSIPKGTVRVRDVYTALPYDNYLVALRLTGAQLRQVLENGVSKLESPAGRFPQVSGLTFAYDPGAPPGSRVKEIALGGKPLDPQKSYVVATNDFLAAGGDGYRTFAEAMKGPGGGEDVKMAPPTENIVYYDPGEWLRDLLVRHLKARKKISPRVEGRIKAN